MTEIWYNYSGNDPESTENKCPHCKANDGKSQAVARLPGGGYAWVTLEKCDNCGKRFVNWG